MPSKIGWLRSTTVTSHGETMSRDLHRKRFRILEDHIFVYIDEELYRRDFFF